MKGQSFKKLILISAVYTIFFQINSLNGILRKTTQQIIPNELLLEAIKKNNPDDVEKALSLGANVNLKDPNNNRHILYMTLLNFQANTVGRWNWLKYQAASIASLLVSVFGFFVTAYALMMGTEKQKTKLALSGLSLGTLSAIGSGTLGSLSKSQRTRLEKTAKILDLLVSDPRIEIDNATVNFMKEVAPGNLIIKALINQVTRLKDIIKKTYSKEKEKFVKEQEKFEESKGAFEQLQAIKRENKPKVVKTVTPVETITPAIAQKQELKNEPIKQAEVITEKQ